MQQCHHQYQQFIFLLIMNAQSTTKIIGFQLNFIYGRTPLHACVETCSLEAVQFLVANGANPNQKDDGVNILLFFWSFFLILIVLHFI